VTTGREKVTNRDNCERTFHQCEEIFGEKPRLEREPGKGSKGMEARNRNKFRGLHRRGLDTVKSRVDHS